MPDVHADLRSLPLLTVLSSLDFSEWKWRKQGTEGYGKCPACQPKRNMTAFSFDLTGKFSCFTCGAKGRGSIDLFMAIKQCGFQEAVSFLESFRHVAAAPRAPTPHRPQEPTPPRQPAPSENPPFKSTYESTTSHRSGSLNAEFCLPRSKRSESENIAILAM
jgi:hypothetical protein